MPRYPMSAVTAKRGVNHVRTVVEDAGSLFIKIEQDNDLGIDALIELVQDGMPLNQQIAVQVKSGQSYYNTDGGECLFPIGNHREYWSKHLLPVYGIVYVPSIKTAHWVDIKRYLKANPQATTIRYQTSEANRFNETTFTKIFVPGLVRQVPTLALDEAFGLVRSSKLDEAYLGTVVLFRKYPNVLQVWDEFVRSIRERPAEQIPGHLIYFLAHVPGHPDIFYSGEQLTLSTREYARDLIAGLRYEDVVKLLTLIDPENSISRGSLGQSVEAVISSIPNSGELLRRVVYSPEYDLFIRECAALIVAMHKGPAAAPLLADLATSGSWYASEMLAHLKKWGHIDPYA